MAVLADVVTNSHTITTNSVQYNQIKPILGYLVMILTYFKNHTKFNTHSAAFISL